MTRLKTAARETTGRLTQRMKPIMRYALRLPQAATPSTSTAIDTTSNFIASKLYANRKTCEHLQNFFLARAGELSSNICEHQILRTL